MSTQLDELLVLLATDEEVARSFERDPAPLVARFGLDEAEVAALRTVRVDRSTSRPRPLEERLSRSGMGFGAALHDAIHSGSSDGSSGSSSHTSSEGNHSAEQHHDAGGGRTSAPTAPAEHHNAGGGRTTTAPTTPTEHHDAGAGRTTAPAPHTAPTPAGTATSPTPATTVAPGGVTPSGSPAPSPVGAAGPSQPTSGGPSITPDGLGPAASGPATHHGLGSVDAATRPSDPGTANQLHASDLQVGGHHDVGPATSGHLPHAPAGSPGEGAPWLGQLRQAVTTTLQGGELPPTGDQGQAVINQLAGFVATAANAGSNGLPGAPWAGDFARFVTGALHVDLPANGTTHASAAPAVTPALTPVAPEASHGAPVTSTAPTSNPSTTATPLPAPATSPAQASPSGIGSDGSPEAAPPLSDSIHAASAVPTESGAAATTGVATGPGAEVSATWTLPTSHDHGAVTGQPVVPADGHGAVVDLTYADGTTAQLSRTEGSDGTYHDIITDADGTVSQRTWAAVPQADGSFLARDVGNTSVTHPDGSVTYSNWFTADASQPPAGATALPDHGQVVSQELVPGSSGGSTVGRFTLTYADGQTATMTRTMQEGLYHDVIANPDGSTTVRQWGWFNDQGQPDADGSETHPLSSVTTYADGTEIHDDGEVMSADTVSSDGHGATMELVYADGQTATMTRTWFPSGLYHDEISNPDGSVTVQEWAWVPQAGGDEVATPIGDAVTTHPNGVVTTSTWLSDQHQGRGTETTISGSANRTTTTYAGGYTHTVTGYSDGTTQNTVALPSGTVVDTVTHLDGSTHESTTQTDGSRVDLDTAAGAQTTLNSTSPDGSAYNEVPDDGAGNRVVTVTGADGTVVSTTTHPDGSAIETTVGKDGQPQVTDISAEGVRTAHVLDRHSSTDTTAGLDPIGSVEPHKLVTDYEYDGNDKVVAQIDKVVDDTGHATRVETHYVNGDYAQHVDHVAQLDEDTPFSFGGYDYSVDTYWYAIPPGSPPGTLPDIDFTYGVRTYTPLDHSDTPIITTLQNFAGKQETEYNADTYFVRNAQGREIDPATGEVEGHLRQS